MRIGGTGFRPGRHRLNHRSPPNHRALEITRCRTVTCPGAVRQRTFHELLTLMSSQMATDFSEDLQRGGTLPPELHGPEKSTLPGSRSFVNGRLRATHDAAPAGNRARSARRGGAPSVITRRLWPLPTKRPFPQMSDHPQPYAERRPAARCNESGGRSAYSRPARPIPGRS